jgi:hypothetical protein
VGWLAVEPSKPLLPLLNHEMSSFADGFEVKHIAYLATNTQIEV